MSRFKVLGAVALLGILACEEATPPPPVGSIVGQVAIEGTGIDGVSVNLSNGNSTTTSGGGNYRFDNVEGGAYTVTISGYPSDATFDATSAAATISSAGQSVTVNFSGAYIRTASVMGTVTVENMGLGGVTVALSGLSSATATTDDSGQYAFTGLRMGNYSVEISGFDSDEIGFSSTAAAVTVGVGESKIVSFDGTYLRTAGIQGRVSVEGEGLEGVTVSLSGGPDGVDETATTDAAGQYSFARLRAGDYQVGISGYDTDDYEFEVTSQNVTVALGETATVPFEGVLLRTSGISGRVSVEGMGLEGITVTLSMADADDMTAMTDAGGLYAFAGLAAGMYTVGIAVESDAYVFESMSMDVTVGDDETAILNFEGMHARTASVSGVLFVDEGTKNDMHDEGEHPLPAPRVPVVLVGPGVNDQMPSATDSTGAFSFMGLRAGNYQLVVTITPEVAMALGDYAYGGSATGYAIELGVGEAHTQNLPFDITHTTVNFTVSLKSGETTGDALPGAMVTLYADAAGETKVGSGETDEMGKAAIRVARAGTTGNTVHAAVMADDYHVAAGMQAVMWDPQMTYAMAANDHDIVNLNVDLTVGGATITTEYGGGDELAGWAISVAHGDATMADTLDAMGMAAYKATVDSAGALPVTYTFSVDTIQDNKLDGGEMFEGTDVAYTHTGLALAGTMDAGTMEVRYTTQTLKVYVHHERDQVMGYTGNILGGDERMSGVIDVDIRYIDENGRSRSFTKEQWDAGARGNKTDSKGVVTFAHVPADANVIVQAREAAGAGDVMLIEPDELAAYQNMEANGVTGGAFGAMGGFSHEVELCPLTATQPAGQDHGECGTFAYVSTYSVSGLVWKRDVIRSGDDFLERDPRFVAGITVGVDPVAGKNLAGEQESHTTTEKPVRTAGESSRGTEVLDETHQFDFGNIAAGVYKLDIPAGWRANNGPKGAETKGLGDALNPLAGDLAIDVTPATGTVFGSVTGSDGFGVDSVTVTVNNVKVMTDALGRYIAEGVASATLRNRSGAVVRANAVLVSTSKPGLVAGTDTLDFAANTTQRSNIDLAGVAKTVTITGTVTASNGGGPVAGVSIMVDGKAPQNAARSGVNRGKLVTGADGTYTATAPAKELGESSVVSAHKAGMSFVPASQEVYHAGVDLVANFTAFAHGTIRGRVIQPGGGPMQDVLVSATPAGATAAADTMTTGRTGTFSLSVPYGAYNIEATAANHTFEYRNGNQTVTVAPGQVYTFPDIQARTFGASNIKAMRVLESPGDSVYTADVKVTWTAGTVPSGHNVSYQVQTKVGTAAWTNLGSAVETDDVNADTDSTVISEAIPTAAGDGAFMVRITATTDNGTGTQVPATEIASAPVTVEAIDPTASNVNAKRSAAASTSDSVLVTWSAKTNVNTSQRIVIQFSDGNWYIAVGGSSIVPGSRSWELDITALSDDISWTRVDGQATHIVNAELLKEIKVAVESVQGTANADNPWKRSNLWTVAAKPGG